MPDTVSSPVLSVLDLVPVSAGRTRRDALQEMIALARTAEDHGYHRYWLAEHHGSITFLASATTVLMGQVLASTTRIKVGSGGVMLPNHAPLVVAEQIGTLATLYPDRVALGLGRAPGTDPLTATALRRRAADPRSFAEEVLETLSYLGPAQDVAVVPGSLANFVPQAQPASQATAPSQQNEGSRPAHVRAIPGEGVEVEPWILGSSVNGARVAGTLGLPFAVASHFAPAQAEPAVVTYRSVFDAEAPTSHMAAPRAGASVNVMVAPTHAEAEDLFTTAMAASARIIGGCPAPLDPPSMDHQAWQELASGREAAVEQAMGLSYVGTPEEVVDGLRDLANRWGLEEIFVVTYAHDAAARRRSYELLGQAWQASAPRS
ncbi:MAG: LLM class flavin-dependent oxidoreductase [Actinomyces urogenitalis]|uniref:LLM class flavin-dependent oxidoreductase n=1 Tax=Actinomyces urogenitalis TaxID=103621 RepID=UPI00065FBA81|nr:LLM class flavin-dependent oxidoreductase [Actinomyces urogenitalis]MBS6072157.1 LLM class flavin-dependent oxidoreductase [Actinomyces urogenitalis]